MLLLLTLEEYERAAEKGAGYDGSRRRKGHENSGKPLEHYKMSMTTSRNEERIYGIVQEPSEGQFYIMTPDPKREGWAVEVAFHRKGPFHDPKSWRSIGEESDSSRYMVLWSQVDTKFSDFLREFVPKIKENDTAKTNL